MKAVQFNILALVILQSSLERAEKNMLFFFLSFEMHNAGDKVKRGESGAKLELVNKLWRKLRKHLSREKWRAAHGSPNTTAFSENSTSCCLLFPILKEIATRNSTGKLTLDLFGNGVLKSSLHQRSKRMKDKSRGKKIRPKNAANTWNSPKEASGNLVENYLISGLANVA